MERKSWALVIVVGMVALTIVGLVLHADPRLIGADVIGALAAVAVIVLGSRSGAVFATRALAMVALLVIAILSLTAHASHWLTAATLAGTFVLAFMTWTTISPTPRSGTSAR